MTIYEKIDIILKLKNKSRRWLANCLELPPSTLQSMFDRNSNMGLEMAENIASALDITFGDLISVDSLNFSDIIDEDDIKTIKKGLVLPPWEELTGKASTLKAMLNLAGYDMQKKNGIYYFLGNGGYAIEEEKFEELLKKAIEAVEMVCMKFEKDISRISYDQ